MQLRDALASRRMVRSFDGSAVDLDVLDELCAEALRAPTAGNSAGVFMLTIGRDLVGDYFAAATDDQWRLTAPRAAGLLRAGAVVAVLSQPQAYLERYGEADKSSSGLVERAKWPVPYWHTDAAMATMALLLLLEEAELQATIWGNFRHDDAVLALLRAKEGAELFATVLVGRSDGQDRRSQSLERHVATRSSRVTRFTRDES